MIAWRDKIFMIQPPAEAELGDVLHVQVRERNDPLPFVDSVFEPNGWTLTGFSGAWREYTRLFTGGHGDDFPLKSPSFDVLRWVVNGTPRGEIVTITLTDDADVAKISRIQPV